MYLWSGTFPMTYQVVRSTKYVNVPETQFVRVPTQLEVLRIICAAAITSPFTDCSETETEDTLTIKMKKKSGTFWKSETEPCAALTLINLAQPEWRTMDCHQDMFDDILCLRKENTRKTSNKSEKHFTLDEKTCVLKNKMCYLFVLTSHQNLTTQYNDQSIFSTLDHFQFLFDAIEGTFPPIRIDKEFALYIKHDDTYSYKTTQKVPNEYLVVTRKVNKHLNFSNFNYFQCQKGAWIHYRFFCDGLNDCPGTDHNDEKFCLCNSSGTKKCKHVGLTRHCSIFYHTICDGSCILFSQDLFGELAQTSVKNSTASRRKKINTAQLPCRDGEIRWYNVSEICSYRKSLPVCEYGENLQNCIGFECHMEFKCGKFYCIPWIYVCDGQIDCPDGADEFGRCGEWGICEDMLKCRDSHICAHLGDICDEKNDCPLEDDEQLCLFNGIKCPVGCECLTFVVACQNMTITLLSVKVFSHIWLNNCIILRMTHFAAFGHALRMSLSHTNLQQLCKITVYFSNLQILDASYNQILSITDSCFNASQSLKGLKLPSNRIAVVSSLSFINLKHLLILDLSHNFLQDFPASSLEGTQSIIILSLLHNLLLNVGSHSFQSLNVPFVLSDDLRVCCSVQHNSVCSTEIPWYSTCLNLLPSANLRWALILMFLFVMLLNTMSIVLKQVSVIKKQNKMTSFCTLVNSVSSAELIYGLYLVILISADGFFQGVLAFKEAQWKSSFMCFIACNLVLIHSILSPILICFLAVVRLSVVLYPLNSKCKENGFVFQLCGSICFLSALVATMLVTIFWFLYDGSPVALCSLLLDPTVFRALSKFTMGSVVTIQLSAICVMSLSYLVLIHSLHKSRQQIAATVAVKKSQGILFAQTAIMLVSGCVSWIPNSVMQIIFLLKSIESFSVILWMSSLFLPVNSIVNPSVFLCLTIRELLLKKNKATWFHPEWHKLSKEGNCFLCLSHPFIHRSKVVNGWQKLLPCVWQTVEASKHFYEKEHRIKNRAISVWNSGFLLDDSSSDEQLFFWKRLVFWQDCGHPFKQNSPWLSLLYGVSFLSEVEHLSSSIYLPILFSFSPLLHSVSSHSPPSPYTSLSIPLSISLIVFNFYVFILPLSVWLRPDIQRQRHQLAVDDQTSWSSR